MSGSEGSVTVTDGERLAGTDLEDTLQVFDGRKRESERGEDWTFRRPTSNIRDANAVLKSQTRCIGKGTAMVDPQPQDANSSTPTEKPQPEVVLDDKGANVAYANFARVT